MDPISSHTAWLYTQFYERDAGQLRVQLRRQCGLRHREASANALQHAFWGFETGRDAGHNNYYVQLAIEQHAGDFEIGEVGVLNLYLYDQTKPGGIGPEAQDQLTMRVPSRDAGPDGVGMASSSDRRRRTSKET
jgi:hypothetical protein